MVRTNCSGLTNKGTIFDHTPPMKKEFSQMAFNFPMEAEPQAPPKNGLSAHPGEQAKTLVLSAEEEHTVREEGRRAGVVVRIKSLKRSPEQIVDPVLIPVAQPQVKAPEKAFIQTSIPLEEIELPIVKAEIPVALVDIQEAILVEEPAVEEAPTLASAGDMPEAAPMEMTTSVEEAASIEDSILEIEQAPPIEEAIPQVGQIPAEGPAPIGEPPFPPRKKSNQRPAAEKTKPAPTEKVKSKRGRKSLKEVAAEADLINIPADEVLFSKQYYTMGEVAEMFRVNQSLLRFWETEFSILQPRKNRKGDRYFRPVDIKNLHLIYHLLRQRKYTIEGAKEFLRKNKKAEQRFEAIQRLQQIKAFLLELKAQL